MNPDSVTELKQLWLMDRNQAANHIKQTTTHEDSVSDKSGLQWLTAAQIGQLEACQPRTKTAFLTRVVTTAQIGQPEACQPRTKTASLTRVVSSGSPLRRSASSKPASHARRQRF